VGLLDGDLAELTANQMACLLLPPERVADLGLSPDETPTEAVDQLIADGVADADAVTEVDLDGRTAYQLDASNATADGFVLVFALPSGDLAVMVVATGAGGVPNFAPTIYRIAATFRRTAPDAETPDPTPTPDTAPTVDDRVASASRVDLANLPALPERISVPRGGLEVSYPAGWEAREEENFIALISPGGVTSGTVPAGEMSVYVIVPGVLGSGVVAAPPQSARGLVLQWTMIFRFFRPSFETRDFGPLERFTLNDTATFMIAHRANIGDVAFIAFETAAGTEVLIYALAAPGELQAQLPVALAIVASIRLAGTGA
jgi:hypothetical protein